MSSKSTDTPEFTPLVTDHAPADDRIETPRRRGRVAVTGGALAAAVVVALVLAEVADDPDRNPPAAEPANATTGTVSPVDVPPPEPGTLPPVAGYPLDWAVVDVSAPALDEATRTGWVGWSIPLPEPLAGMRVPADVVALTDDGVVHRLEIPSGRVRSRSLPAPDTVGQIAVIDSAVAIPQSGAVVLVGDDGSVLGWALPTGDQPRVMPVGSDFVVTTSGETGDPKGQWTLSADGSSVDISSGPFTRFPAWEQRFVRTGDLIADDGAGIVSVSLDDGVRRIGDGRLVGTGPQHYVTRVCETSACDYEVVDVATGQRTPAELGLLDEYRFFDTSVRVSPDGRFVQYADWRRDRPIVRIVDAAHRCRRRCRRRS